MYENQKPNVVCKNRENPIRINPNQIYITMNAKKKKTNKLHIKYIIITHAIYDIYVHTTTTTTTNKLKTHAHI